MIIRKAELQLENPQIGNSVEGFTLMHKLIRMIPPLTIAILAFGFFSIDFDEQSGISENVHNEIMGGEIKNAGKFNILSSGDLSTSIKDTVYTDKECWLELRINEQMLYQHWRNGKVEKYPISSGNKYGDAEALESRPGLFAIFLKEEHHQSTQFNSANMYHFMPFNQGIGFHSIDGTGYYANLGVRPSSHGCIRMKHADAEKIFKECPVGTLVIGTKGYSARVVSFAPEGFKNEREYTKEEYKRMLALNLYNLLEGKYYVEDRYRFIVDPKVIPVSGVYNSYDVKLPDKQLVPRSYISFSEPLDIASVKSNQDILPEINSEELVKLIGFEESSAEANDRNTVTSTDDLVKKYFNNPIGVLPYFGPKK